jgi:hypothetical protein
MDALCVDGFFDRQASNHPEIVGRNVGPSGALASLAVVMLLVPLPIHRSVVLSATCIGTLSPMVLPAAKGAAEILAARIPGMSQEANSAPATRHRAIRQTGTTAQNGIQRQLILTNKRVGAVVLVPVLAKS